MFEYYELISKVTHGTGIDIGLFCLSDFCLFLHSPTHPLPLFSLCHQQLITFHHISQKASSTSRYKIKLHLLCVPSLSLSLSLRVESLLPELFSQRKLISHLNSTCSILSIITKMDSVILLHMNWGHRRI